MHLHRVGAQALTSDVSSSIAPISADSRSADSRITSETRATARGASTHCFPWSGTRRIAFSFKPSARSGPRLLTNFAHRSSARGCRANIASCACASAAAACEADERWPTEGRERREAHLWHSTQSMHS